jgi:hypothetical protein
MKHLPASKPGSGAFAVVHGFKNFQVQHNKAPKLEQLVIHQGSLFIGDFHGLVALIHA